MSNYDDSSDVISFGMLCTMFSVPMGILLGWGLSLVTKCGSVDVSADVNGTLSTLNCSYINCDKIEQTLRRHAMDSAVRACFYYCGYGALCGLFISLIGTLCVFCIKNQTVLKRICMRMKPTCPVKIQWATFIRSLFHRSAHVTSDVEIKSTLNIQLLDPQSEYKANIRCDSPLTPRDVDDISS